MKIATRVCIIGAGAGGIGCAYRLIKNGIQTVLIDKNPDLGGTMTYGGIDGWEPGVSLDGMHREIAEGLLEEPFGAHVVEWLPNLNLLDGSRDMDQSRHSFAERPWGYNDHVGGSYDDTLARCESLRSGRPARRFQFDSDAFIRVVHKLFAPYKDNLTELYGCEYLCCETDGDRIISATVKRGDESITVTADIFVDASGDIVLARDAGCAYTIGTEGHGDYGEPSATERSSIINAVTYAFRVAPTESPVHVDDIPEEAKGVDLGEWTEGAMKRTVSLIVKYPNGDLHVNMLPTMQSEEYFSLGKDADTVGRARVYAYWNYLQTEKGLSGYTIKRIYDAGVRESYRLIGKYVLREQDMRAGKPLGIATKRTVAIADHIIDVHGKGKFNSALDAPYEIPIECTETLEYANLFVACRGASFTHLASSSARLSRTMISIGEGVGEYISELLIR